MTGYFKIFGLCAVLFIVQVSGLTFTVSRDKVVKGSTGTLQFNCDVTESDVDSVFLIQILRETTPGSGVTEVLAEMKASETTATVKVTGVDKGFVASGTWDGANTFLALDMDMTKIQCSDARAYSCALTYLSLAGQSVKVTQNSTFSVFVNPLMTSLDAKKNGMFAANSSMFDVGDILELTCRANIGSFPQTKIEWERTSETSGSVNEFRGYTPPPLTFSDGDSLNDNQCGYTRTATITYNVTAADANRENNLAFRCFVTVSGDPYGTYTTQNKPSFFVGVEDQGAPPTGPATAGSVDTGAIAGGIVGGLVLIVIIVLLVYFLWYRRRSSGEDYLKSNTISGAGSSNIGAIIGGVVGGLFAIVLIVVVIWFLWFRRQRNGADYTTKEEYGSENPNMAPPADTYASVDKHRKRGHENRGLDEPHEARRHYENGPGKSNRGMDRDADDYDYDSRDGSPTRSNQGIGHMGMDTHGGIGTGV